MTSGDEKPRQGQTKFDAVEVACPKCARKSRVLPQWVGKAPCPECGTVLKQAVRPRKAEKKAKVPKIVEPSPDVIKCGFCEADNPSSAKKCSICKEALTLGDVHLDLAVREDEFKCPRCKTILLLKARFCSGCNIHFCNSCKKPVEGEGFLCGACAGNEPPPSRHRRR